MRECQGELKRCAAPWEGEGGPWRGRLGAGGREMLCRSGSGGGGGGGSDEGRGKYNAAIRKAKGGGSAPKKGGGGKPKKPRNSDVPF